MVVREGWRNATLIYLYMVLCQADASDPRVVRALKNYMRLVNRTNPGHMPDVFLSTSMVIAGVAASKEKDRHTIRQRILQVPECSVPEIAGYDSVLQLEDVWQRTKNEGRPAVWSDWRIAYFVVTGIPRLDAIIPSSPNCNPNSRPDCKKLIGLEVSGWKTMWYNEKSHWPPYEAQFLEPGDSAEKRKANRKTGNRTKNKVEAKAKAKAETDTDTETETETKAKNKVKAKIGTKGVVGSQEGDGERDEKDSDQAEEKFNDQGVQTNVSR